MAITAKKIKVSPRLRRKIRIRKKLSGTAERPRISVYRSDKNTYVQAVCDDTAQTIASASTVDKDVKEILASLKAEGDSNKTRSTKGVLAAQAVGLVIAKKLKEKNFLKVVFDRNGFIYHGRIAAVAEGARKGGLQF